MSGDPSDPSDADAAKGPAKTEGLSTRLTHTGRDASNHHRGVNPPVQRASTILLDKADQLFRPGGRTYGRHGSATHDALKQAYCELESATHCLLAPSGLMACILPMLALTGAGDHVLVTDNVYGPTRRFCERMLPRLGVTADFFNPDVGADIARLMRPNTRVIFLESPGSMTFEIADAPAIAAAARAAGAVTVLDNTWAAGVFHRPLDLGVDLSVQASTKYVSGGADVLSGAILTRNGRLATRISETIADLGVNVSADDAYLVLRGLRTLTARLDRHAASAMTVARWLQARPEIVRVVYPALESDPYHALWKRDFSGATGLFSIVLRPAPQSTVNRFLDCLRLFGLGFSWGGFESLAIPCDPQLKRTATQPGFAGPLVRLSIGLEDPADLIADLEQAFAALA